MRKVLSWILALALVLPLCACSAAYDPTTGGNMESVFTTAPVTTATPPITTMPPITTIPTEPTVPTVPTVATEPVDPNKPTVPSEPTNPLNLISEARTDGLLYQPRVWCIAMSSLAGVPISFNLDKDCYPGMELTFEASANCGSLWDRRSEDSPKYVAENGWGICWRDLNGSDPMDIINGGGAVFVDVIIRADGWIVGYGIFEISSEDGFYYAQTRCETVIFPVIDGHLQYVTEEYVAQKLAECKQTITPFNLEEKRAEETAYLEALRQADEERIANLQWMELDDVVQIVGAPWWDSRGKEPGIGLQVCIPEELYPGMDITYKVYVYGGVFLQEKSSGEGYIDIGRNVEVEALQTFYWGNPVGDEYVPPVDTVMQHDGVIFVEIKFYAEDQIIGYAVVEIGCADGWLYFPVRNETHVCTLIDGELQPLNYWDVTRKFWEYDDHPIAYDPAEKLAEYQVYLDENP